MDYPFDQRNKKRPLQNSSSNWQRQGRAGRAPPAAAMLAHFVEVWRVTFAISFNELDDTPKNLRDCTESSQPLVPLSLPAMGDSQQKINPRPHNTSGTDFLKYSKRYRLFSTS
jgi:hypothetical protein